MKEARTGGSEGDTSAQGPSLAAPGRRTLTGGVVMRKASEAPTTEAPADAFDAATAGSAGSLPYRNELEQAFGTGLGNVQFHAGPSTEAGLDALGAEAAAHGDRIATRSASPDLELIAHEVAHVVQQRAGGASATQRRATGVSQPDDAAERRADAAAAAVVAGTPVPDVGTADGAALHRFASHRTNGGTFRADDFFPFSREVSPDPSDPNDLGGRLVGGHMMMRFEPADPVIAESIGLVQSIKRHAETPNHAAAPMPSLGDPNQQRRLEQLNSPQGVSIDQPGQGSQPSLNPAYATQGSARRLSDARPAAGNQGYGVTHHGEFGHRVMRDGRPDVQAATLRDDPRNNISLLPDGQYTPMYRYEFEVTALVLDGPLANTYLGSVDWGWHSDAQGAPDLNAPDLVVTSQGAPGAAFMGAARQWNDATLDGQQTVDLPVRNAAGDLDRAAIHAMPTTELIRRVGAGEQPGPQVAAADQGQRRLEFEMMESELMGRHFEISCTVEQGHDMTNDDVRLVISGGGDGVHRDLSLGRGDTGRARLTFREVMNRMHGTSEISISAVEQDVLANTNIGSMTWRFPFETAQANAIGGGARYLLSARLV